MCWLELPDWFGMPTDAKRMAEFKHPQSRFYSFLQCKCPRCGVDKVFVYNAFKINGFAEIKDFCSHCRLNYFPETGFYFGAMYWSYAMLVAMIVILSLVLSWVGLFAHAVYIIPAVIILLLPVILRYSRMLMLYIIYPAMYKGIYRQ